MIFKMVLKLCFSYSSSLTSSRRLRVPMLLEPKLQVLMLKMNKNKNQDALRLLKVIKKL
jgi:hypothetical protein